MNTAAKKTKRKLSVGETIWTVTESIFGIGGLTLLVLGIVSDYLPSVYSENYLAMAEQAWMSFSHTSLSFRWLGIIAILIGSTLALITLNHYAKKTDADDERELRRAQRLQVLNNSEQEVKEVVSEVAPTTKKD